MTSERQELLLLWDNAEHVAATVRQQVEALQRYSRHAVRPLPMMGDLPIGLDLDRFDGVIIHYSLVACMDSYVSQKAREQIAAFRGVKALFIQDEYRFVNRSIAAIRQLGIHVLFTCVPEGEIDKIYPEAQLPGVQKVNVLTGYVDDSLLNYPVTPYAERTIDIGYRARKVPAWLGELGQEKWRIGQVVARDAAKYGLKVDLAYREEERLYGDAWLCFLANCRATLGVESGASVFDFTGEIQSAVDADLALNPGLSFEEVRQRHFANIEGKVRLNQISPRCFEAAALKTLMILYEGEYSGRLQPWRHYLPLKKDHSNFAEIVAVLRDQKRFAEIVDCAYQEVALNPLNSFQYMVSCVDCAIDSNIGKVVRPPLASYGCQELESIVCVMSNITKRRLLQRKIFTNLYIFVFRYLLGWLPEPSRDRIQRWLGKVIHKASTVLARQ